MDLKKFKIDQTREKGVWLDVDEKTSLKIARWGNPAMLEFNQTRISRSKRLAMQKGLINDEGVTDTLCKILANTILLDWKGIEEGGKEVSYSVSNAERLLKEYEPFRLLVFESCQDEANFYAEEMNETIKNSPTVSGTTSNSEPH